MSNLNMPEPVGTYDVLTMNPFRSRVIDVTDKTLPDGKYPIYTAEALRDVLEQAAQLFQQPYMEYFGQDIQDAIRAMIEEIK